MGMKLDSIYHGMQLPGKFKMSVSGCKLNCAESWVRDIGLYGGADGWVLLAGGNVGASPRIAQELMSGLNDDQALQVIEKAVNFYKENAKKGERLGKMIDRIGFESLNAAVN
jgi:NAD(P)H-nitrite reductase large subunit